MMSSNTMRTATENANMTGSMSGELLKSICLMRPDPANLPTQRLPAVLPLAVMPAACTVVPSSLCSAR